MRSAQALRLGEPVIVTRVPEQKSSEEGMVEGGSEISSEMSFEEGGGGGAGAGAHHEGANEGDNGQGSGERDGRLLHSTRASSGVFPEGRESRDEEVDEERIYS